MAATAAKRLKQPQEAEETIRFVACSLHPFCSIYLLNVCRGWNKCLSYLCTILGFSCSLPYFSFRPSFHSYVQTSHDRIISAVWQELNEQDNNSRKGCMMIYSDSYMFWMIFGDLNSAAVTYSSSNTPRKLSKVTPAMIGAVFLFHWHHNTWGFFSSQGLDFTINLFLLNLLNYLSSTLFLIHVFVLFADMWRCNSVYIYSIKCSRKV